MKRNRTILIGSGAALLIILVVVCVFFLGGGHSGGQLQGLVVDVVNPVCVNLCGAVKSATGRLKDDKKRSFLH